METPTQIPVQIEVTDRAASKARALLRAERLGIRVLDGAMRKAIRCAVCERRIAYFGEHFDNPAISLDFSEHENDIGERLICSTCVNRIVEVSKHPIEAQIDEEQAQQND